MPATSLSDRSSTNDLLLPAMILNRVDIVNFKNIASASLEFSPGVNCLLGRNGMGKSNLLEAINFLSMARPLTPLPESALITHGRDMLLVKGDYTADAGGSEQISCGVVRGKGKTLKRNGKEYTRISEHIGRFPIVAVSPADSALVSGGGEERRRLMDMVISQADNSYLSYLIRYTRSLESRNRMLRAGVRDKLLYESVEAGMAEAAKAVNIARRQWTERLTPVFEDFYRRISGGAERASLTYRSVLNDASLPEVLEQQRAKDITLGFTSRGVHRDDLDTALDDYSMRRLGSQGQIKTFTIALRLAIFSYLREARGVTPILLLDDIFDKLDSDRVARIMATVSAPGEFGQIFVTDTNRKHLDDIIEAMQGERRMWEVADGVYTPINIEQT